MRHKEAYCFSTNPFKRLIGNIRSYMWEHAQRQRLGVWRTNWKGERYCLVELDKENKMYYTINRG